MERGFVHGGTGVAGGFGGVTENSMPEISFDWTANAAIATVFAAAATIVLACYAYKAHKFVRGYWARVSVSVFLHPNDDIAEWENRGDENREVIVRIANNEDRPVKIEQIRCDFKKFMSADVPYNDTMNDILQSPLVIIIESNSEYHYERNLSEVKRQAKGRKRFCVSVKHSLSPKPATASIQLPQ